mmetsp:Transcript_14237/g.25846  ORF Transcript_14237/g.25846 Transcript_14237/m.25846 type:complete len:520 (-) Transcript_14237:2388-3947(-)
MEPWAVVLLVLACIVVGVYLVWLLVSRVWAPRAYRTMIKDNVVSVDDFVGSTPSGQSCVKVLTLQHFSCGSRKPSMQGLPLVAAESDKVPGLYVTKRADSPTAPPLRESVPPLVIGTIRMGFGHHRIAYAASSWGLNASKDRKTYFHDFLNIDSPEATLIEDTDKLYSKGSRWASELGGIAESAWGGLTKSGDEDSLRLTYQMAEHLRPVIAGLDKRSVIVASHSLVASAAVAAGFKNVINLVIDNHAQWFVVVPGALNLVQGPTNYHDFLRMGVPADQLACAGHWCPRDLVESIPETCAARIRRAANPDKPVRLLIPVGGAGAQRKFVTKLIVALAPLVKKGKVQLFLNAGDHAHMKAAFIETLAACKLDYGNVTDMDGVMKFRDNLLKGDDAEPSKPITLFGFEDYFTAVATSDLLIRVSDVLVCKPAEMAFYPVPKLMVRRVGDHEAYSALRTSELGDGTLECRTIDMALKYIHLFGKPELLTSMNKAILQLNTIGIYDGCKNAIQMALDMAATVE